MELMDGTRLLANRCRRRNFLLGAGFLTGLTIASQWHPVLANSRFSSYPFSLGVASGDPLPDGVVIWTRLAPNPLSGGWCLPRIRPLQPDSKTLAK